MKLLQSLKKANIGHLPLNIIVTSNLDEDQQEIRLIDSDEDVARSASTGRSEMKDE